MMMDGERAQNLRNSIHGKDISAVQAGHIEGGVHIYTPDGGFNTLVNQLPTDTSDFIGRHANLVSLDSLLGNRTGRSNAVIITAISGAPGIGKTALAVHWAHRVSEHFPDGQLYVNLRGYDPGVPMPPDLVLESFLKAFGVPDERIPHDVEALSATYRSIVANRRVLVVLDNARTTSQVLPLLPGSPSCTVVVTSRNRLSGLVVRTDALRIDVDVLSATEAVALLRRRIVHGIESPGRHELERLAELCGRLPLALRIAAERVAEQPDIDARDLIDELSLEWERLDALAVDDGPTTVRSVFSWSYRALDPELAQCFRLLGLHPGPEFGVGAASTLVNRPVTETRRRLQALAGLHLLSRTGRDRYQFHDLIRVYAAEMAVIDSDEVDRRDAVRRVLSSYLRQAVAASRVVYPNRRSIDFDQPEPTHADSTFNDRATALSWYEIEQHNLSIAIRLAATTGENDLAWKLPAVLTDLLWKQRWTDTLTVLEAALNAAAASGDRLGQLHVLDNFADLSLDLERYDKAAGYFTRMKDLALEIGDNYFLGWSLNGLGKTHVGWAEVDEAVDCFRGALEVFQTIRNQGAEGAVLESLATALLRKGRPDEALAHCKRSLAIAEDLGDLWRSARAEKTMGLLHDALGRPDLAIGHLERALSMHLEFDNRFDAAQTLTDLGDIFDNIGRREDAVNAWNKALVALNDLGAPQAAAVKARLDR
jgi:tetratricopeptide (TPR) repeat protein